MYLSFLSLNLFVNSKYINYYYVALKIYNVNTMVLVLGPITKYLYF